MNRRDALQAVAVGSLGLLRPYRGISWPEIGAPSRGQDSEILIRGGRVVNADGARDADVRIIGDMIAEIGSDLGPGADARVIDAGGRLVMPGGIDPHTHLSGSFVDDFTSGSVAALAGGITTLGTFAYPRRQENALEAIDRYEETVRSSAIADIILHASTWPPTPEFVALMPSLAERGQPSLKIFMTSRNFNEHLAETIELLEAARDAGVVTMIHCEDGGILRAVARQLEAAGKTSLRYYGESRPVAAEVAATQQAVSLCKVTGAPMHVVHLSAAAALQACRNPRTEGLPLFVETRPLYLHLTEERLQGPDGPLYVGQPPLRTADDANALWQGLADGSIDILATDHAPWTREQKLDPELSITRLRPGINNLQFMLPMYFSEGVGKGRISLERFVETTSTKAARIFGLFPQKGVIREGSYADVVVWDPERTTVIRDADVLSRAAHTVYDGWSVTGWPEITFRRGEVVFEAGEVNGRPGSGRLLTRAPWRSE